MVQRRILIINPIVDGVLMDEDRDYFQQIAFAGTEIEVVSIKKGPKSIETFYDAQYAGPEILRVIKDKSTEFDAFVINCFADPALDAAREVTNKVVVGPGEAAMSLALHLGATFAVISVLPNTSYWVRIQARKLGVESRLAKAIGINTPVLELYKNLDQVINQIVDAAQQAVTSCEAEVIILGCTGMVQLAKMVRERLKVPVIEPAAAALKMAELLVDLNLSHYRGGGYLPAAPNKIIGYP